MRYISTKLFFTLFSLSLLLSSCNNDLKTGEPASYINPFIGTDGHGHTYPGAATPFGMVQLSPQTRLDGWDGCSGYHYTDSLLYGFAHTALSGTGVSDYGDILVMPYIGEPVFDNNLYNSHFSKENEEAEAGYYRVFLNKPEVWAEMTATTRTGYHRYTFPESENANLIIDLKHRDHVVEAWIEIVSDTEIRGMRRSTNWANNMVWYFHMEFSKPFKHYGIAIDDVVSDGLNRAEGKNIKAYVGFNTEKDEVVEVKVGLSAVDAEGAYKNLKAESPDWNFDQIRQNAFNSWNETIGKVQVKGGTKEQNTVFYTAMYHAFLQPNTFMDVDRRYRGMDRNIHTSNDFTNYTVFSLWDTYRTWHPLMTILEPNRSQDFVRVMLDMYEKGGLLPIWELAANETYCMIGNHSISVIADAWIKGLRNFDGEKAMQAMLHSATQEHHGLDVYQQYGFIPGELEHESVSKTLEYAYNDWCIAVMAKDLGLDDVYNTYIERAQGYKHIFDPESGFMRPRMNGGWLEPFDPTTVDWHFTEANSWHYSFYVPQDITGFTALHGGKEKLAAKIDELFNTEAPISGRDMKDITGLIGQYAQGNEPSHHMAYLYNFVDQPWKTQYRARQIMDELYTHLPDGLSGNEDCGQMSAWLIMSAMGFYPVSPGQAEYVIGTPWFPEMEMQLENGNTFKITANKVSKKNFYIQSASLNGATYSKSYISHQDIVQGGHLYFEMGPQPNKNWGTGEGNIPVTHISENQLLPVPVVKSTGTRIRDFVEVAIESIEADCDIYYSLDESLPNKQSMAYTTTFRIDNSTTLKAVAWKDGFGYSKPVVAQFVKIDHNRSIRITPPLDNNYHGGGPEALIDGMRGVKNFRLGNWHGYQGIDFEAVVDLGSQQSISYVGAGFLQEIRSWIWLPTAVRFSVSADGKNFRQVALVESPLPIDSYEVQLVDIGSKVSAKARYVKIEATSFGTIPDWHLGAGGQAWIFIDEVVVE
jgi:predicted alpha-1,2-mannosidase